MDKQQLTEQQIATLLPELQKFIATEPWLQETRTIGFESGLSAEQVRMLEDEVMIVLIALDLKINLAKNLRDNLGVTALTADSLSQKIDSQIFSKIINFLPNEIAEESELNENNVPSNLPTGEVTEEKILDSVGSPGEKLAWEQRKQIAANTLPKVEEKKYNGVDPYREPLS